MASNYTEHYGLSLWEPGDAFRREEFNRDHERVDAGLRAARRAAEQAREGVAAVDYNVYNLLLQSYYAGKSTAWKRAVVFDGFRDGAGVAALGGAMVLGAGGPCVSRNGQGSVELGYGGNGSGSSLGSAEQTAAGAGRLTGATYRLNNNYNQNDRTATVTCTVTVNGKAAAAKTVDTPAFSAFGSKELKITLDGPVCLCPGDRFSVGLRTGASDWRFAKAGAGEGLGGTLHITPVSGSGGSLTTAAYELPACGEVRAWVRHTVGTVSLTAGGRAMERVDRRETVDVGGVPCLETEFRLEQGLGAGRHSFVLGLELGEQDQSARLCDYGAVML